MANESNKMYIYMTPNNKTSIPSLTHSHFKCHSLPNAQFITMPEISVNEKKKKKKKKTQVPHLIQIPHWKLINISILFTLSPMNFSSLHAESGLIRFNILFIFTTFLVIQKKKNPTFIMICHIVTFLYNVEVETLRLNLT